MDPPRNKAQQQQEETTASFLPTAANNTTIPQEVVLDLGQDTIENSNKNVLHSLSSDVTERTSHHHQRKQQQEEEPYFVPMYFCTRLMASWSTQLFGRKGKRNSKAAFFWKRQPQAQEEEEDDDDPFIWATWLGFWALLWVTCANAVVTPVRDAIALTAVGVAHLPQLTVASSVLAVVSAVPIGWLFEAPDPQRRLVWKKMGITRGETQGTSLALFYRFFATCVILYAIAFWMIPASSSTTSSTSNHPWSQTLGHGVYVMFFLMVHLMKLHSLSLVWGVTSEAMEYEEVARQQQQQQSTTSNDNNNKEAKKQTRLQRLALVGFGGTLGGILGSILASSLAQTLKLSGLLILAAILLEVSAELSIELGRIMQKHWEDQQRQLLQGANQQQQQQQHSLVDSSMRRSTSLGSMKRVASGNSIRASSSTSLTGLAQQQQQQLQEAKASAAAAATANPSVDDDDADQSFTQRLLRGVSTILQSRLLMAIFTYNALYASTTTLLSFERAQLVATRNKTTTTTADTAFLANINMASSVAVFVLQATGGGAAVAHAVGPQGSLALMPLVRLAGVIALGVWHKVSDGQSPNLILFLLLDEWTRVMNLAVAKPVRESLWRGLSMEARYEAKPIVDTLANRWGGGSAAFLVSVVHKIVAWMNHHDSNDTATTTASVFGFPPVLFLCLIVATWWVVVSFDLGQIRRRIDLELKKRQ